ncbi:heat shock protein [Seminavis robusta]|uniref:Heat shock protein n=1 Tax=Seminavis robusta TaxID=568900 RepID=A0A9N8F1A7_9STRA|nr:heat shock protein [Seminavis robusta]|eukprot:Sro2252_g320850.1 heat shock protein (262) ;mRNA; f:4134-4919
MNLAAAYLSLLTFGLFIKSVEGYDLISFPLSFDPPSDLISTAEDILDIFRSHENAIQHAVFRGAAPFFSQSSTEQFINTEDQFKVVLDVGGMTTDNVAVSFDESKRILTISGHRQSESSSNSYFYSDSHFSRSFSVDPFVQVDQMKASVDNGVLTVWAPKDADRMHHAVRSIPIQAANPPMMTLPATQEDDEPSKKNDDPFHVKERVEKAQLNYNQQQQQANNQKEQDPAPNSDEESPLETLLDEERSQAYKTSELRRRRQ